MKIFRYIFNSILVIGIIAYIVIIGIQEMEVVTISTSLNTKKLKSFEMLDFDKRQEKTVAPVVNDLESKSMPSDEKKDEISTIQSNEDIISDVSTEVEDMIDVLETQTGSLSGYGPDCVGCSGFLASGLDVRGGNIYYADSVYGNVRILAGDRTYPYGTIVRVKSSKFSEFIGIVLDRGGGVGFGKRHLFDLLYTTSDEALSYGVSYNTTFEILRYGY